MTSEAEFFARVFLKLNLLQASKYLKFDFQKVPGGIYCNFRWKIFTPEFFIHLGIFYFSKLGQIRVRASVRALKSDTGTDPTRLKSTDYCTVPLGNVMAWCCAYPGLTRCDSLKLARLAEAQPFHLR